MPKGCWLYHIDWETPRAKAGLPRPKAEPEVVEIPSEDTWRCAHFMAPGGPGCHSYGGWVPKTPVAAAPPIQPGHLVVFKERTPVQLSETYTVRRKDAVHKLQKCNSKTSAEAGQRGDILVIESDVAHLNFINVLDGKRSNKVYRAPLDALQLHELSPMHTTSLAREQRLYEELFTCILRWRHFQFVADGIAAHSGQRPLSPDAQREEQIAWLMEPDRARNLFHLLSIMRQAKTERYAKPCAPVRAGNTSTFGVDVFENVMSLALDTIPGIKVQTYTTNSTEYDKEIKLCIDRGAALSPRALSPPPSHRALSPSPSHRRPLIVMPPHPLLPHISCRCDFAVATRHHAAKSTNRL